MSEAAVVEKSREQKAEEHRLWFESLPAETRERIQKNQARRDAKHDRDRKLWNLVFNIAQGRNALKNSTRDHAKVAAEICDAQFELEKWAARKLGLTHIDCVQEAYGFKTRRKQVGGLES